MARAHHYELGHLALRGYCHGNPRRFFAVMASADQGDFVQRIWSTVRRSCDDREETDIDPAEIRVNLDRIADHPTIMIEMPEARETAEAIFVGIVLTADLSSSARDEDAILFRYFTLELGENLDGSKRTVLCEWSGESHLNFGDGPEPTLQAFAEAIEAKLAPTLDATELN